ncbi:hypothetical protein M1349_00360 [Patescibacteria group bacterium]|nr:hypothetical protein [Patescibacteria group bacterium]
MKPESGITTSAQITSTPKRRAVSVEVEVIQQTAFKILDLAERFRNPQDVKIVWDDLFESASQTRIAKFSAEEVEAYTKTIAGRLRPFYSAIDEINGLKSDPTKIFPPDEIVAYGIHPDRRVAELFGKSVVIKNPVILTILLARKDFSAKEVEEIMKKQKAMGLPKTTIKTMLEIQEEMTKLDFKPTPDHKYDHKEAARWLRVHVVS